MDVREQTAGPLCEGALVTPSNLTQPPHDIVKMEWDETSLCWRCPVCSRTELNDAQVPASEFHDPESIAWKRHRDRRA